HHARSGLLRLRLLHHPRPRRQGDRQGQEPVRPRDRLRHPQDSLGAVTSGPYISGRRCPTRSSSYLPGIFTSFLLRATAGSISAKSTSGPSPAVASSPPPGPTTRLAPLQ